MLSEWSLTMDFFVGFFSTTRTPAITNILRKYFSQQKKTKWRTYAKPWICLLGSAQNYPFYFSASALHSFSLYHTKGWKHWNLFQLLARHLCGPRFHTEFLNEMIFNEWQCLWISNNWETTWAPFSTSLTHWVSL